MEAVGAANRISVSDEVRHALGDLYAFSGRDGRGEGKRPDKGLDAGTSEIEKNTEAPFPVFPSLRSLLRQLVVHALDIEVPASRTPSSAVSPAFGRFQTVLLSDQAP